MDVESRCRLPAIAFAWQPHASAWAMTIVVKGTFELRPGVAALATEQEAPLAADNHWDDDPRRSLHAARDRVPFKPRADVVLVGHAFVPAAGGARSLSVRLRVGEIDKEIDVFCNRSLGADGQVQEGPPFSRMPLVYERTAGGPDTWNPVGMRLDNQDRAGRRLLPNIVGGGGAAAPHDRLEPAGFGPLAPNWPPRWEKLAHLAAGWDPESVGRAPLPDGLDLAFFNVAPPDQQLTSLRDDELIELTNLSPEHPHLTTRLPGVRPRAVIEGGPRAGQEVRLHADTLWIDTDQGICAVTWRGQVAVEHPQQAGRVVVSLVESPSAGGRSDTRQQPRPEDESTAVGLRAPRLPELPFLPAGSALPFTPAATAPAPPAAPRFGDSTGNWPAAAPPPVPPAPPAPAAPRFRDYPPSWRPPSPTPQRVDPPAPAQAPRWHRPYADTPPPPAQVPAAAQVPAGAGMMPRHPLTGVPPGMSVGAAMAAASAAAAPVAPRSDGSVLGASNAAADPPPWTKPRASVPQEPEPQPAPEPAGFGHDRALHLVWHDPESVPRVRRKLEFRAILDAAAEAPLDPDFDDLDGALDPRDFEDRRDTLEILLRGEASDGAALNQALRAAVRKDGKFVAPIVLVEGDLILPFDEKALLEATVAAAAGSAAGDDRLKAAIADAEAFLAHADRPAAPSIPESLAARVRAAHLEIKGAPPAADLDAAVERALLTGRRYQKREILGGPHLRALLVVEGAADPLPTYLPASLAGDLPMAPRLRARLIAALHFALDRYEASLSALSALALGCVTALRRDT